MTTTNNLMPMTAFELAQRAADCYRAAFGDHHQYQRLLMPLGGESLPRVILILAKAPWDEEDESVQEQEAAHLLLTMFTQDGERLRPSAAHLIAAYLDSLAEDILALMREAAETGAPELLAKIRRMEGRTS